jgi:uncharacterized membrane protein (UPF0182 family)
MGEQEAQKAVLAVIVVTTAIVLWDSIKKTGRALPPFKSVVALSLLAAVLMLGASIAPALAGPFALLVGLAVVVTRITPAKGTK